MGELKIVGWVSFDSEYPTKYVNEENMKEVLDLVRQEIIEKKYMFSGEEHQNASTGAPVFSDGTCFRASMRCFGAIMASIYRGANNEELSYMDFYMYLDGKSVLPESNKIDVKPNEDEEPCFGLSINQDKQIIMESLSLGMPFMTTDKVLQELYEYFKFLQEQENQEA